MANLHAKGILVFCLLWDTGLAQGWEMEQAKKDSSLVQRKAWRGGCVSKLIFLINILFTCRLGDRNIYAFSS